MNPVIVSCGWDKVVKVSHRYLDLPSHFLSCSYDVIKIFATSEEHTSNETILITKISDARFPISHH